MQTHTLYYENCHLDRFTGRVVSCRETEKGYAVTLDATAFYPEGGGQAADTGMLGTVRVLHTREEGDTIVHLCDGPLEVGEAVEGRIDYALRFRRMQQHTGEHIVSGIVNRRFGFHNTGFHMGADVITIDFDGVIPPEELPRLEEEANRAVWANLPVRCFIPSPEELEKIVVRSANILNVPIDREGAREIAKRSRGTPHCTVTIMLGSSILMILSIMEPSRITVLSFQTSFSCSPPELPVRGCT